MAQYSLQEVAERNGKNGSRIWLVINDVVYDVTDYLEKHPGGLELINEYAGTDATSGFKDFGHSSDAKRLLKGYAVGELIEQDKAANRKAKQTDFSIRETRKRRFFLTALCGKCVA